jgi:Zn-dependent peptidase ImmA (M78 family)
MDIYKIVELIPPVIADLKKEYVFSNDAIKDGIFNILEKHCVVVYYPLGDEATRGFHVKRFVKDKREDFVYINTAKPVSEQIFAAAHELGHVWDVAGKIAKELSDESFSTEEEEFVINRFAAELLMPSDMFKRTFYIHALDLNVNQKAIKLEDLVRIAVMQMNDYMVPYEAVRRRLVETKILSAKDGKILDDNRATIEEVVKLFAKDQNTMLDRVTEKKTIPGLRSMLERIEKNHLLDDYSICKIKKDFDIDDVSGSLDELINIEIGEQSDGK